MTKERKRETENGINFDRSYWPESGTVVPSLPTDLNDLWDDDDTEAQARVFIAEALLSDAPHLTLDFDNDEAGIMVFLWSVGGDCMTLEKPLPDIIERGVRVYNELRGPGQVKDVESYIAKLESVEAAIQRAKDFLRKQIADYKGTQSE